MCDVEYFFDSRPLGAYYEDIVHLITVMFIILRHRKLLIFLGIDIKLNVILLAHDSYDSLSSLGYSCQ